MLREQSEAAGKITDPKFHTYVAAALTCALIGGAIGFAAGYGIRSTTSGDLFASSSVLGQSTASSPKPSDTPDAPSKPTWAVDESKSPVDDSPSVILSISTSKPTRSRFGSPSDSQLIVRCREHKTELYIALDDFLGSQSSQVIYRIDDQPSRTGTWSHSTDGKAVFAPGAIPLSRELATAKTLFARISDFRGTSYDVEFEVEGLSALLPKVAAACKWDT